MKIISTSIVGMACALLMTSIPVSAASAQTITYKNERGSTLTLMWHAGQKDAGTLTGTFTTAVGKCKEALGHPIPVNGYYNGNAVALTMSYPACGSLVAMTGNFNDDNSELKTLWLLGRSVKDTLHANWDSNTVGSDVFKKQMSS